MSQAAETFERPDDLGHKTSPFVVLGLIVTLGLHAGIFAVMWYRQALFGEKEPEQVIGAFVDAQLVRFGKPRDLSFLPHKQGVIKNIAPPEAIKVATDINAAPAKEKKEELKADVDPLKKTHSELFKNLPNDDRPAAVSEEGGSLSGSRAGTSDEAKGDPYILALIDQIGSKWTVPTTIPEPELAKLTAEVCLTIDASGRLTNYRVITPSGNSQFDSSLEARLSTIKVSGNLPEPPPRFASIASRGRLCATFSKQ